LRKGASFPTNEIELSEIDRIILFTDGVLEAENQSGEPFFEKRLMEIIKRESSESLESLLNDILDNVLAFSDRTQFNDDVCLLGVDVTRT
jgi:sigma-B regulation protein RsbU (phosphoserine phosphatase)